MADRRLLVVADVSPLETHGGAARVLREQSLRLAARGFAVTVFCRHPGDAEPPAAELGSVRVIHYAVRRDHPLAFAVTSIAGARGGFRRALDASDWDAVIFHQPFSAVGVRPLAATIARRLYVYHSPASTEYRLRAARLGNGRAPAGTGVVAWLLRRLERRALGVATRVVVLSEFSRAVLARTHGAIPAPVTTIPGGVDIERFRPAVDRAAVRRQLGFVSGSPLVLTVRDLQPRMGLDTLLEALASIEPSRRPTCVIGGTGGLREPLEQLARRLGLGEVVRFAGHIPEEVLPLHYQAADLFVLPTQALEGFGLVTVEALACSTPVVATPVGATPEILGPLDARLLAADSSADALAAALVGALPLVADDAFRQRCRRYAVRRYGWERHVETLEWLITTG